MCITQTIAKCCKVPFASLGPDKINVFAASVGVEIHLLNYFEKFTIGEFSFQRNKFHFSDILRRLKSMGVTCRVSDARRAP